MKQYLKTLTTLLSTKQKQYLFLFFLGAFLISALEIIGLGSIVGFVIILSDPYSLIEKIPLNGIKEYLIVKDIAFLAIGSTICLAIIFIVKNLIVILFHYFELQVKRNVLNSNHVKLYKHYLYNPYSFYLKNNPARLINNITAIVIRGTHYIFHGLLLFREVLLILSLVLTLLFVDWKLSFIVFILMSIVSLLFYLVQIIEDYDIIITSCI